VSITQSAALVIAPSRGDGVALEYQIASAKPQKSQGGLSFGS